MHAHQQEACVHCTMVQCLKGAVLPGMSMVPLADIFNHKAAVVALAGGYSIEQARFFLGSSPFLHMPALAVFPGARCKAANVWRASGRVC